MTWKRPILGGRTRPMPVLLIALLTSVLPACDWPNDESDRRSEYRDRIGSVMSVSAPDSAAAGTAFDVTVFTSASNGCWSKGRDDVARPDPLLVRITPYDRELIGGDVCPAIAPVFEHMVRVHAAEAGKLTAQIQTRLRSSTGKDSIGTIERIVTIY